MIVRLMRRREFISVLGGAVASPLSALAQPAVRMRRVAVLMDTQPDSRGRPRLAAFVQALADQGLSEGRDVQIDIRWGASSAETSRNLATELLAGDPDIILASGSPATAAMRQATTRTPIVFVLVADPVGAGFVDSLASPGGNLTGFTLFEYSIAGKWLELLKELAPAIKRVAVLRDIGVAAGSGQFGALQAAAPSFGVELRPVGVQNVDEIERGLSSFAPGPTDGLIVTASPLASAHREKIIALATQYRMPSAFAYRHFVSGGGLVAYGPDLVSPMPRAASYVSRILRGEKAGALPVQAPTTYELVVNSRTAKALGLTISPSLLARADEVIE